MVEIETQRLRLRRWLDADRAPFAALNADPVVTEFLPAPLTRAQSDVFATRIEKHFSAHGFGLYAVEIPGVTAFAGYVGFAVPVFEASFTPCVEIGWRLAAEHWGHGYATEAALAVRDHGFSTLGFDEILSFTVPRNRRSRAVMERIGMRRSRADDFDHPSLPPDHPLRRHVLYRCGREVVGAPPADASRKRDDG